MKRLFNAYYNRFGDKGVRLFLLILSFAVHLIIIPFSGWLTDLSTEFNSAAISSYFSGTDLSATIEAGLPTGYLSSLAYIPFFYKSASPFLVYHLLLVVNAAAVSFIAPIAYSLFKRFEVQGVWFRMGVSLLCGLSAPVLGRSKLIAQNAVTALFPWLLLWLLLRSYDSKHTLQKILFSFLTALVLAGSVAVDFNMVYMTFGVILLEIIWLIYTKRSILNLQMFIFSLFGFFASEYFLRKFIMVSVFKTNPAESGFVVLLNGIKRIFTNGSTTFFATLYGQIYYILIATGGLFAVVITYSVIILLGKRPLKLGRATIFPMIFYAFMVISASVTAAVSQSAEGLSMRTKDTFINGKIADTIIPLTIFMGFMLIKKHGLTPRKIAGTIAAALYTAFCFSAVTMPVLSRLFGFNSLSSFSILPFKLNGNDIAFVDDKSFMITTSVVLIILAVICAISLCGKKDKSHIAGWIFSAIAAYSTVFTIFAWIPEKASVSNELTKPAIEISNYIYNEEGAPKVIAYGVDGKIPQILQLLNMKVKIIVAENAEDIPAESLILTTNMNNLKGLKDPNLRRLGNTTEYAVYAYGKQAVAYAVSKHTLEEIHLDDEETAQTTATERSVQHNP